MSKIKYRVEFKTKTGKYQSKDYEFNDDQHWNNWYNKQLRDESYRKIVGFDRIYSEAKEFSVNDLNAAFFANNGKITFQQWFKIYTKQEL